jgi:WD40 repeat protein
MRLRTFLRSVFLCVTGFFAAAGCAGVKGNGNGQTGSTGSGGTVQTMPSIAGLTGITISPSSATVQLQQGTVPGSLTGGASFTAMGSFQDGSSMDVTDRVNWQTVPQSMKINGDITVSAPGIYTITASSGSVASNSATLNASFSGSFVCSDLETGATASATCAARGGSVDSGTQGTLNGDKSGTTTVAYPLANSLFPSNLGPIQFQLTSSGTAARFNFGSKSGNLNINYYGNCEMATGSGCSVTIPLALTQLLVGTSAAEDVQITGRVLSGGAVMESATIMANWAESSVTGGLYYWSVIPGQTSCPGVASPPNYCLQDAQTSPPNTGTAIYRYDFSADAPAPQRVWTDDGGPNTMPAYQGSPQSWNAGVAGGHCIGCHSITNDGKYMALTIGGSSSYNGSNWELLDIANQALLSINPTKTGGNGCNDPNASPSSDPTCYWQSYRKDAFATETTWGPDGTVMVSMYKSKLYLNTVAVAAGGAATIAQSGPVFQKTAPDPYQSDPFWSHDGTVLAFTSFAQAAAADPTGNPGGVNGDLKTGGQIAITTATQTSVMDDAHVLVTRDSNVTSYYPCVSEDSQFVVFNQSTCSGGTDSVGDTYGSGTCDGYDDSSAKLWWVSASGGATVRLDNANGGANTSYDNSWPRFSPDVGTFRGGKLYWVAFSSRRPYGVQLNNTSTLSAAQPQLWFTGVVVQEVGVGDPSYAPVWLPGQDPVSNGQVTPLGNHTPQWVKTAVMIN